MTLPDWCMATLPRSKRDLGDLVMRLRGEGYPITNGILKRPAAEISAELASWRKSEREAFYAGKPSRGKAGFDGITGSECNDFLAKLPLMPFWGEKE